MIALTNKTLVDTLFPYGTFPIDSTLRECYVQNYSRAQRYILPDYLPHHHPLLKRLEGTYSIEYMLPPWWPTGITQVKPEPLRHLLSTISAQEFRAGCIEQSRWKAFRESLSEKDRRQLPTSPKVAALLEQTGWSTHFQNRGPADTPDQIKLVISTRPLDFLYMSNGREWRSCQHYQDGCENHRLPGNFYDTGVAVAMLLHPNMRIGDEESVLARTTLRVFHFDGRTVVAIGRTYHNNETLAFLLLCKLADLLDTQYLSWGFMIDVNALSYCEEGLLGPGLDQRIDQEFFVEGDPCWFPDFWFVPYVDGGDMEWRPEWECEADNYSCMKLHTTVMLIRPRFFSRIHPQTRHAIRRLHSVGMLPPLL